jgi:hypothetical protein
MGYLYDLLFIVAILLVITLIILRLRRNLLVLWKEVSAKEIIFYRLLRETIKVFYLYKDEFKNEDNRLQFVRLGRARKKKIRSLLLKERQDLYLALSDIYNGIEEEDSKDCKVMRKQFQKLQKARRIYNSKVLIYNQTISVFPTRFLAIKMNLKIKEYFG